MARLDDLINELKKEEMNAVWITKKANFYYYSNHYTDPHERIIGIYADSRDEPVAVIPAMEKQQLLQAGWKGGIIGYSDGDDPIALLRKYLEDANRMPETIGMESDHVTVQIERQLTDIFPEIKWKDASPLLSSLRAIKDKKECILLKKAASLADFGVKTGIEAIREGKKEIEIVAEIEFALKKEGIREMSFSTMVLAGENTSSPHGNPGNNQIRPGDLVLFDLGVVFEGYCSDITRTVAYKEINDKQKQIYETVRIAQQKAIEAAKPGNTAGAMDQAARSYIEDQGFGEYFTHRVGHGIGIDVHEYPSLHSANELKLKEGMAFTIEPGIYIPDIGGVRIEDQIFMTSKGPEVQTSFPKELQIIE